MAGNTVVLVHGWGGSFEETWRKPGIVDILGDTGNVVVGVDLLGHGSSAKPHEPEAYEALGSHLAAQLPDEPCIVVAFSLGAMTTLRLAVDEPNRFSGLVLAGIGDRIFEPHDPAESQRIIAGVDGTAAADDNIAQLFGRYARQGDNDPIALAAVLRRKPAERLKPDDLAHIMCPVLVCIGDKDFAAPAHQLATAFPDGQLAELPRTDHFATPNSFPFIDAVVDWLETRFPE
jgi:pimeloyl-ACP methyl ester carboxylesterase